MIKSHPQFSAISWWWSWNSMKAMQHHHRTVDRRSHINSAGLFKSDPVAADRYRLCSATLAKNCVCTVTIDVHCVLQYDIHYCDVSSEWQSPLMAGSFLSSPFSGFHYYAFSTEHNALTLAEIMIIIVII